MAVDYTYHDDETMLKVWTGLKKAGLTDQQIVDAAHCVMNEGVVFRESLGEAKPVIVNDPPVPPRGAWGRKT